MAQIPVEEKKLQRGRGKGRYILGLAHPEPDALIQVEPRQSESERMDSLCHEAIHIKLPDLNERQVRRLSRAISRMLWKEGYRRVRLK